MENIDINTLLPNISGVFGFLLTIILILHKMFGDNKKHNEIITEHLKQHAEHLRQHEEHLKQHENLNTEIKLNSKAIDNIAKVVCKHEAKIKQHESQLKTLKDNKNK
jgi:hypothetical protein